MQAEEQKPIWAAEMYTLLLDMNTAVKEAKEKGLKHLDPSEVADWKAQYEVILQEGYLANPPDPPPSDAPPKRGRRKPACRS